MNTGGSWRERQQYSRGEAMAESRFNSALSICIGVLALYLQLPAIAEAQQLQPLRVAVPLNISWLPTMIAKERGLFEKNGLDVTLTPFTQVANLPGAVGKQFDIAASTPSDLLYAAANGLNVAGVAANTFETNATKSFQILVRDDAPIHSPADLAGKRVAGPGAGSVMHVALLAWLRKAGSDGSGIVVAEVPFPNMSDQLKAGRVDAVEQIEPFVGFMLKAGFRSIGDPLLEIADPILFTFWIADADWAAKNTDALNRYKASLTQAAEFIRAEPAEARAILAKYTKLPEAVIETIPFPTYGFQLRTSNLATWRDLIAKDNDRVGKLDMTKIIVSAN
jgi:NitT/TauT family transport system substrate-binding protein